MDTHDTGDHSGIFVGAYTRHDSRLPQKAVGTLLIGYTGEEDDSAHLFLNMDKAVEDIEGSEYAVLRIKKVQARK